MHKGFLTTAALLGAVSVGLGAFGAHALRQSLSPASLAIYETAVRYQFYHVFALALTGVLAAQFAGSRLRLAGTLFISGIILFSGSLYLLCFMPAYPWLGAITPLGGACFIAGWIFLALAVRSAKLP